MGEVHSALGLKSTCRRRRWLFRAWEFRGGAAGRAAGKNTQRAAAEAWALVDIIISVCAAKRKVNPCVQLCTFCIWIVCVASRKAVSNRPAILSARFFFVALCRSNSTREISIFGSRGVARKGNTHVRRRGSFCCKWKKCTGLALVARQAKYCNDLWLHIGACNRLICTRRAVRLLTAPTTQAFSPFHRPAHTSSPQGSVILFPTKDQVLLWQTLIANYPYSDNNGNETRQVRCRLFQETNFTNI